jgi:hypothetical protein
MAMVKVVAVPLSVWVWEDATCDLMTWRRTGADIEMQNGWQVRTRRIFGGRSLGSAERPRSQLRGPASYKWTFTRKPEIQSQRT